MKIVLSIIGVILVILMFGTMIAGIKTAQTDERTDSFGAVTTGGGITTASVVLVADLFDDSVLNVTSVTSSLNTDVPLVNTYVPGTNTLSVVGLTASETRTLTVIYKYGSLTGTSAPASSFFGFLPLLVVIALVVIVIAAMVAAFKK